MTQDGRRSREKGTEYVQARYADRRVPLPDQEPGGQGTSGQLAEPRLGLGRTGRLRQGQRQASQAHNTKRRI